jgi:hypothetical protein
MAASRFPTPTQSADDLGAPSDFGAGPLPRSSSRVPLDDEEEAEPSAADALVTPEALNFHDDEQRCDMCQHFGRAGQCAVLKMPVPPEGGCNAFRNGAGDEEEGEDEDDINPAATRFEDEDADYDYRKENPRGAYDI